MNPLPSNPLESFTYDPVGNRVDSNQNGAVILNQAHQLLEDGDFTYQYDNNGNLTRKTAKVGGAITSYDAENKLVRVVSNGTTINYKYDGLGRRVEKEVISVSTTVTRYIYDNEDMLLELDGSNNITARYTHGPGIDEPLVMEKGGASFFYHADGLGSITEITDTLGAVKQRYTYSSFGKIESQLDPSFVQPYTFTAREFDPETGLYFYRHRVLDPNTGRFISEDPLPAQLDVPLSINRYLYVGDDPVRWVDPWGLARGDWWDPRTSVDFWRNAVGGAYDLWRNYRNMREANTIGADRYFHCKANCEGSRRGFGGRDAAEALSEARELFDQYIKRDPPSECDADRAANRLGRQGAPNLPCQEVCKSLRPPALDPRY